MRIWWVIDPHLPIRHDFPLVKAEGHSKCTSWRFPNAGKMRLPPLKQNTECAPENGCLVPAILSFWHGPSFRKPYQPLYWAPRIQHACFGEFPQQSYELWNGNHPHISWNRPTSHPFFGTKIEHHICKIRISTILTFEKTFQIFHPTKTTHNMILIFPPKRNTTWIFHRNHFHGITTNPSPTPVACEAILLEDAT